MVDCANFAYDNFIFKDDAHARQQMAAHPHIEGLAFAARAVGRGLHSFTSQLNGSGFHGIWGASKGCLGGVWGCLKGIRGCLGCMSCHKRLKLS
jgi:hypothetical protein